MELRRTAERKKSFTARSGTRKSKILSGGRIKRRKVQAVVDWAESKNEGTAQASAEEGPNQTNQD